MGRLEYQRGNYDAALQVFQGIDINGLTPRMKKAIQERTRQRKPRSRGDNVRVNVLSMHSVSLLLEAILLKARSLEGLGRYIGNAFSFSFLMLLTYLQVYSRSCIYFQLRLQNFWMH